MKISFAAPAMPKSGALCVGVLDGGVLTPAASAVDQTTGGQVSRAIKASKAFNGKGEQVLALPAPAGVDLDLVLLFGLGKPKELSRLTLQKCGGALAKSLLGSGVKEAAVQLDGVNGDAAGMAASLAAGARLRSYRFDKYLTKQQAKDKPALKKLTVQLADADAAKRAFKAQDKVIDGVFATRDLVSEPANVLHPESFADQCKALSDLGVEVDILDEKQMGKLGMEALLAVGRGSSRESRLVTMSHKGGKKSDPTIAIVGKGVTFDTGGISLKPGQGMWDMKWDMGGAGVVVGLMHALAGRKAKVNVVGVIGLVENMPSGNAQRPGDIVKSMSGQTIEVLNTDAEGRLVLCDALWYTQETFKPATVIDLATLTGAIIISLGGETAGLFANDDALAEQLTAAGKAVDEPVWRLPMGPAYDKMIDADLADMKNIAGSRDAGSIVAAQFLQRFIKKDVAWAHLDIAGVTWSGKDRPLAPKGGTGFGVRLLDRYIADVYEV
jgi:leucyl aminopeptidase